MPGTCKAVNPSHIFAIYSCHFRQKGSLFLSGLEVIHTCTGLASFPYLYSKCISWYLGISRCLKRTSRPVHSSIVAFAKLPNRKSSWALASSSAIKTRQLNGKLGNVAAAHTTTTTVTDTVTKYNKKKATQFQSLAPRTEDVILIHSWQPDKRQPKVRP